MFGRLFATWYELASIVDTKGECHGPGAHEAGDTRNDDEEADEGGR